MLSIIRLLTILFLLTPLVGFASNYATKNLCGMDGFGCIKVKRGQTWKTLWPDPVKRRIVMRLNRMNTKLWAGQTIAIPENLEYISHMDISPLPHYIEPMGGRKIIYINLAKHAFGAYDKYGNLLHWGPVAGGRGWCPDKGINGGQCNTPQGDFYAIRKEGAECISSKYPVPNGGAHMPFCIYFFNGFAMHAGILPGNHASHGCVRLFYEDAEWLNKNFITLGKGASRVIVR